MIAKLSAKGWRSNGRVSQRFEEFVNGNAAIRLYVGTHGTVRIGPTSERSIFFSAWRFW